VFLEITSLNLNANTSYGGKYSQLTITSEILYKTVGESINQGLYQDLDGLQLSHDESA